jgi:glycosyltransferase involved in cell wall biosynthesis
MGGLRERVTTLSFLVPGDPETLAGDYIYDRWVVEGLGKLGRQVHVHFLGSSFPRPTPAALWNARIVLGGIPAGRVVVIDGLALGGMASVLEREAKRLRLVGLVHYPLALETGLDAETAGFLEQSERASLALVRRAVVTSSWTSRKLREYGIAADRIRVVRPGVVPHRDPHRIHSARHVIRNAGRISLNLLCVAPLTLRKGHAVLFGALALLRDRLWHLYCAGSMTRSPGTADNLRRQIERLGLGPRISLLGEIDPLALERYYGRSDVFVLASFMEGYGMAAVEAIAYGIPVVGTSAGAIPESVPAGASLLVPPGDERALAEALARVMDDPATLRRLTVSALAARKTLPTWSEACNQFAAALDDLAGIDT